MTDTLLSRAIRLLVGGDATAVRDRGAGAILSRHRRAFLERFRKEDAGAGSIGNLSMEFVVWFTGTVRLEVVMHQWVGMDGRPAARTGFLTFRAITILFDDPGKVFRMRADERAAYFASGAYLQDVRCDFFLDFDRLTDQLSHHPPRLRRRALRTRVLRGSWSTSSGTRRRSSRSCSAMAAA